MTRILLIDDDRHANDALAAALTMLGYTSDIVSDTRIAVERVDEFNPDIAIVDYAMPGMSGLDLIAQLSAPPRRLYCAMATGMADFGMLKRALSCGAWTLLGKPFQLAHLSSVLQSAAVMVAARDLLSGFQGKAHQETMTITRRGETPVNSEDIAHAMQFARQWGADADTAERRLPIIVYELLTNARVHGALMSAEHWYRLNLENSSDSIRVSVSDAGHGFPVSKELSRARTGWDKSKATGLQLVSALCNEVVFGGDEFTATAMLSKKSDYQPASVEAVAARHHL